MLSLTKENQYYQVFLVQSLGMGIGNVLVYLPTMTLVSQHMRKHRAFAMVLPLFPKLTYISYMW